MIHPREALVVARADKAQAKLDNPNVVVLSPGDKTMGHRFDRIVVKTELPDDWRGTLRTRAAPGCKWTKK